MAQGTGDREQEIQNHDSDAGCRSFPYAVRETLAQQQTATTVEKNRGRLETRTVTTTTATIDEQDLDWPGAKQLIRLERHTVENGQARRSTTYAITSTSADTPGFP